MKLRHRLRGDTRRFWRLVFPCPWRYQVKSRGAAGEVHWRRGVVVVAALALEVEGIEPTPVEVATWLRDHANEGPAEVLASTWKRKIELAEAIFPFWLCRYLERRAHLTRGHDVLS